jgi:hypothetical protein
MMRAAIVATLFLAACATSTSMTPRANTRDEIVAYVNRAADLVSKHGPSCDAFGSPTWFSHDWYVFVLEPNGRTVCHPARPDLVGTLETELADPNGKPIGREFLRVARENPSGGWVDYVWARPGQTTPVAKSAFVRQVTGVDGKPYIVGSGGYELR